MSEVPDQPDGPELPADVPRPPRVPTWRERIAERLNDWADSLDLTPTRLAVGVAALAVIGVAGWRLLAPPVPPSEMQLPFPSSSVLAGDQELGDAGTASATATDASAPGEAAGEEGDDGEGGGDGVVVHVAGAVVRPGVHRLAAGARAIDAVDAAGGALAEADLGRLNLAALVEDGQQVYVPRVGEERPSAPDAGAGSVADASGGGVASQPVDLNTATVDELDELPGIGPSIAAAIASYRDEHGPFTSVDQLIDVRGIGEARLEELRDWVVV